MQHPLDDHYREIYRQEKAKKGGEQSSYREVPPPPAGPSSAWGEEPHGDAWAEDRSWPGNDVRRSTVDQVARLEKKLREAYDEADAKSKALQATRLEAESKEDEVKFICCSSPLHHILAGERKCNSES